MDSLLLLRHSERGGPRALREHRSEDCGYAVDIVEMVTDRAAAGARAVSDVSWVTRPESNDYKRDLVLIGFEADEDEVLVSNFLWWHDVLANFYHNRTIRAFEELERRAIKPSQRMIEKSWARIFVPASSMPKITRPEERFLYQATLWTIPVDNIVSVSVARARERPESRMSLEELSERRRGIFQPPHAEPFRVVR